MKLASVVVLSFCVSGVVQEQRGSASIPYDQEGWQLIKQRTVNFATGSTRSRVLLLRSRKVTGSGGLLQPMKDVEVLVLRGDRIIYDRAN